MEKHLLDQVTEDYELCMRMQAFAEEGTNIALPIQVDVRDVGRAHVLAAEVIADLT